MKMSHFERKEYKGENTVVIMNLGLLRSIVFILATFFFISSVSAGNVIFRDGKIISSGNVSTDEKFVGDGSKITNITSITTNPFNQNLNTTSNVTFDTLNIKQIFFDKQYTPSLVSEVMGKILDFGVNYNQSGIRNISDYGGFIRIDSRGGSYNNSLFQVIFNNIGSVGGGNNEKIVLRLSNDGVLNTSYFVGDGSRLTNISGVGNNPFNQDLNKTSNVTFGNVVSKQLSVNSSDGSYVNLYHMSDATGSNIINSLEANGTRTQLTINQSLWIRSFTDNSSLFFSGANLAKQWYFISNDALSTLTLSSTHFGNFIINRNTYVEGNFTMLGNLFSYGPINTQSDLNVTGSSTLGSGVSINTTDNRYALNVGGSANITGPLFMNQQINTPQVRGGNGQSSGLSLYGTFGTATSANVKIGYNSSDSTLFVNRTSAYLFNDLIGAGTINSTKDVCIDGGKCLNRTIEVYTDNLIKNNSLIYFNGVNNRWESLNTSHSDNAKLTYCSVGGLQWLTSPATCPL
ncbi:hypothetical protein J4423_03825 [Candidatus Pacearchaeota archaeon]|nr:hypothetical protein [Candidatus Pacearchaeota archaeon]